MTKAVLCIAFSVLTMSSALLADEVSSPGAENVTTFALVGGHILGYGKATLIVRDGRIERIASAAPNSTLRRVNADGRYIAPAFIDSHVHLAYGFSALSLRVVVSRRRLIWQHQFHSWQTISSLRE